MKHIHIFVEEPSIKKVLDNIVPKVLPENTFFSVYPHQGKQDLERALNTTLPSISKIPGARIIISRDQDSSDCIELKNILKNIINGRVSCQYKIRIVCKELESWFLGDLMALERAFPRFKAESIAGKAEIRDVDSIVNPSTYILKVIPEYSKTEYLPKVENAERISQFMVLDGNQSKSYNQMIEAVKYLARI